MGSKLGQFCPLQTFSNLFVAKRIETLLESLDIQREKQKMENERQFARQLKQDYEVSDIPGEPTVVKEPIYYIP